MNQKKTNSAMPFGLSIGMTISSAPSSINSLGFRLDKYSFEYKFIGRAFGAPRVLTFRDIEHGLGQAPGVAS